MSGEGSARTHWRRTRNLMVTALVVWFIFSFVVHWVASALNGISFLGFPLGFYLAAQGSFFVFVGLMFWLARAERRIDRDTGIAEDE